MSAHDEDAWLDAFGEHDLDDPELARVDAAVERLAASAPPQGRVPRRVWPWLAGAVVAAGLLLGVGLLWTSGTQPTQPVTSPVAERSTSTDGVPASSESQTSDEEGTARETPGRERHAQPGLAVSTPPSEPAPAPQTRVVPEHSSTTPPELAPEPRAPGLFAHGSTELRITEGVAHLDRGVLAYVHDAAHEPSADAVRSTALGVVARPVGTAFVTAADSDVAVFLVTDGRVRLHAEDGTLLSTLERGDEVTIHRASEGADALLIRPTAGIGLDEIKTRTDDPSVARQAVALVTRARLAARDLLVGKVIGEAP